MGGPGRNVWRVGERGCLRRCPIVQSALTDQLQRRATAARRGSVEVRRALVWRGRTFRRSARLTSTYSLALALLASRDLADSSSYFVVSPSLLPEPSAACTASRQALHARLVPPRLSLDM